MRWQGRRESDNVEDRRSDGGGGPSMGGPGFRLPSGKGGIILLIVVLVAGYYGVDLTGLMTGQPLQQQQHSQRSISPNEDEAAKFTSVILATTEDTWGQLFEKMGRTYQQPKLVMYRGATRTGCGTGQSVMGPFYCPADGTVYIDLSFYDDMKRKLGADGDFAQGYVIAHEVGHHVQKLLGIEPKVRQLQQNASPADAREPPLAWLSRRDRSALDLSAALPRRRCRLPASTDSRSLNPPPMNPAPPRGRHFPPATRDIVPAAGRVRGCRTACGSGDAVPGIACRTILPAAVDPPRAEIR